MGSILTMFLIIMIVSVVLGVTRRNRPSLGDSGYPPEPLAGPQQPYGMLGGPAQFGAPSGFGGPPGFGGQGFGQPGFPGQAGYDPAAHQPMTIAARDAIDADITTFGGELRDLDLDVVGQTLTAEAQDDYSKALDAYDGSKQQLFSARTNADVRRIAEILEEGRYNIACVKARANGQPVPEHRAPCFFDPAHGVSVADVTWAPAGGAARQVPACAADVQRIRTGNDPSIRMVNAGAGMVPYWNAREYAPWAQGYYGRYGMDPTTRAITHGALGLGAAALLMGLLEG